MSSQTIKQRQNKYIFSHVRTQGLLPMHPFLASYFKMYISKISQSRKQELGSRKRDSRQQWELLWPKVTFAWQGCTASSPNWRRMEHSSEGGVWGKKDNLFKTVRGKNERQLETMKNKRLCRNAENALLAKE